MFETIKNILLFAIAIGVFAFIWYLQYLTIKDRYDYIKKHGVDPWRHGWELDNDDKENKSK